MPRREKSFACSFPRRPVMAALAISSLALGACDQAPIEVGPDAFRIRRDAALDAPEMDAGPPPVCPPQAPFGPNVGDRIGDITLYDCAGTPVQLHSLCETDVVWLWELAEWCSPCRRFADGEYDAIYERYETRYGDRFTAMAIITADDQLNLPNQVICEEMRETYGIDAPLYFDPTNTFRDLVGEGFSNDVHAILTRGLVIQWDAVRLGVRGPPLERDLRRARLRRRRARCRCSRPRRRPARRRDRHCAGRCATDGRRRSLSPFKIEPRRGSRASVGRARWTGTALRSCLRRS